MAERHRPVPMVGRFTPNPTLIPLLWIGLALVSVVATVVARPRWWTWIAPEASLAREINTAMLLATSASAFLAWRGRLRGETKAMMILVVGFLVLAVDERVAIHERLRDRVLAPRGVNLPFIPWAEPGDVVLVVVTVIGLAVLRPVLRAVSHDRSARRWFLAGVVLAVIAVGLDTLPIETYRLENEIRFQSAEEAIELIAAGCFLSAMWWLTDRSGLDDGETRLEGVEVAEDQQEVGRVTVDHQ